MCEGFLSSQCGFDLSNHSKDPRISTPRTLSSPAFIIQHKSTSSICVLVRGLTTTPSLCLLSGLCSGLGQLVTQDGKATYARNNYLQSSTIRLNRINRPFQYINHFLLHVHGEVCTCMCWTLSVLVGLPFSYM